jgi:hypothetical protein
MTAPMIASPMTPAAMPAANYEQTRYTGAIERLSGRIDDGEARG